MSSDIAIKVENLSKCYQIYEQPRDRLKQFVMPRIQRGLGKKPQQYYREFWALKDVSFEVKKGETVGIIGRNGSGKSTLLQLITGTLTPTAGSIMTNGRIAALLELGSGFNPDFSGRENVYLNGILLGLTREKINEKFDAIAAFADIGDYLDQPVKTYSTGMLVRLAFAVQVQVAPDILIVDEALAVGDWLFQKRCFQRIEKLISDGTTLLFVSHDQESVRTLTNRALLLSNGGTKALGTSSEVVLEYRKLLHDQEAAYFSALSQNVSTTKIIAETPSKQRSPAEMVTENTTSAVRSGPLSFGDGHVKVVRVEIHDVNGGECSVFYPGDVLKIRITCRTSAAAEKLNVGVRLRNKEGVKIYSWGTLNQDMARRYEDLSAPIFWSKSFASQEDFAVDLEFECVLGVNLYEVQASVSYEETPDYLGQRILHWIDEAAFFQVLSRPEEHFFGGVLDLRMNASW